MMAFAETLVTLDNRGRVVARGQIIGNYINIKATEYEKVLVIADENDCRSPSVRIQLRNAPCPNHYSPPHMYLVKENEPN